MLLNTPRRAADAGVLYIPNDRQREGLFLGQTVERNLTVTRLRRLSRLGVLLRRRIQRSARELATMAASPSTGSGSPAGSLSGGNQQKVLLGRALQLEGTALLALDEPTRGVDVGGRAEIHELVREAARKGTAVIFSSTELDEVLDLADVVVTMFAGRIVSVVPRAEASASAILADMTTSQRDAQSERRVVSGPMAAAIDRFGLERRRSARRRRARGLDRGPGGGDGLRRRDDDGLPDVEQPEGDPHRGGVRRDHRRRADRHHAEREPLLPRPRPDRRGLGDVLPLLAAVRPGHRRSC